MVPYATLVSDPHASALARIARDLVKVRALGDGGLISTPVLFPSGTHVTVRVSFDGDRCLVTDDGSGFLEAEYMGGPHIFRRAARRVAEASGVRFNSFELFEADANPDTVPGIIAIVADASRRAVEITAERLADRAVSDAKSTVLDRLTDAFGADHVDRDVPFSGASAHSWSLDALVRLDNVDVAVAVASAAPVSVSSTYVKLDDIRRLDDAPRTVVALAKRDTFKSDQLALLNRTARLIDFKASTIEFRRLAA